MVKCEMIIRMTAVIECDYVFEKLNKKVNSQFEEGEEEEVLTRVRAAAAAAYIVFLQRTKKKKRERKC